MLQIITCCVLNNFSERLNLPSVLQIIWKKVKKETSQNPKTYIFSVTKLYLGRFLCNFNLSYQVQKLQAVFFGKINIYHAKSSSKRNKILKYIHKFLLHTEGWDVMKSLLWFPWNTKCIAPGQNLDFKPPFRTQNDMLSSFDHLLQAGGIPYFSVQLQYVSSNAFLLAERKLYQKSLNSM